MSFFTILHEFKVYTRIQFETEQYDNPNRHNRKLISHYVRVNVTWWLRGSLTSTKATNELEDGNMMEKRRVFGLGIPQSLLWSSQFQLEGETNRGRSFVELYNVDNKIYHLIFSFSEHNW